MKAQPSTPLVGRSLLIPAIVLLLLSVLLTIMLLEPSSAQKQISSEEAADFLGDFETVCGRVSGVYRDSIFINALLLFGDPKSPSFTVSLLIPGRDLERKYKGKQVCVTGRIVDEWEPSGFPSITVTNESQIANDERYEQWQWTKRR